MTLKVVERPDPISRCWWECKEWCEHFGKSFASFLTNKHTRRAPRNPILTHFGKSNKIYVRGYTCKSPLTVALFIIALSWKWPPCPSSAECMRKVTHLYDGMLPSNQKEWTTHAGNGRRNAKRIVLPERRQTLNAT